MRTKFTTLLTVVGAATILVLAANTVALATTGKAILAGKVNTSTKLTAITRTTPGSALQVNTKSSTNAPFVVNGTGKVANLNADKIDGLDSSALANPTSIYEFGLGNVPGGGTGFNVKTPTMPAGTYLVSLTGLLYGPVTSGSPELITCQVAATSPDREIDQDILTDGGGTYVVQLAGSLTLASAQVLKVSCTGPFSYEYLVPSGYPVRITLTKVNQVTTGSLVAAP